MVDNHHTTLAQSCDPKALPQVIVSLQNQLNKKCHNDRPETWGPARAAVSRKMDTPVVNNFVTAVIVFNMLMMILEADQTADGAAPDAYITWVGSVLLVFYTVEISLRFFVWRLQFFLDGWNILDFLVVALDWTFIIIQVIIGDMPRISVLRVFRLVKLARAIRALNMFPELRLLLKSFVGAFKAIFWGVLLIMCITLIWSILAVQVLHPYNKKVVESDFYERAGCERCPRAFATVFASFLTIWQTVVAGDSWGTVALPIIEEAPHTLVFFVCVLVTVSMAIMNLILAVICEKATEAREEDRALSVQAAQEDFHSASQQFLEFCKELDTDSSGSLSRDELICGFETNQEFANTMDVIGFRKEKVDSIIAAFDTDGSGDIRYRAFVDSIMDAKNQSLESMLLHIKLGVMEMQTKMDSCLREMHKREASTSIPCPVIPTGDINHLKGMQPPLGSKSQDAPTDEKGMDCLPSAKDRNLICMLRTMVRKVDQEMSVVMQQVQGKAEYSDFIV